MSAQEDPWARFRVAPDAPAAPAADADPWAQFRQPQQRWATDPETGRPIPGVPEGAPVTIARNPTGRAPAAESAGRPIQEGRIAPPAAQAAAGLGVDPEQRRRIYAGQTFPNLTPAEALSRVGYGVNQRMFAVGDDGQPYYLEPASPTLEDRSTLSPANLTAWALTGTGAAMPMAGGLAGGLMAAPSSIIGGPAAAGGGAALGEMGRQLLANQFDPQMPNALDYGRVAQEGAMGAVGQLGAGMVNRAMAPNPLRISPDEATRLRGSGAIERAGQAQDEASRLGVTLTPGQASNSRELLLMEDAAMQNPRLADRAVQRYTEQGAQLETAGQRMLDSVSPNSNKTGAALQFREGAEDVPRVIRQDANRAARPDYDAARAAGQQVSPDLAALLDNQAVQQAMEKARETYRIRTGREPPATPDFELWDLTKRSLDDLHRTAAREGDNTRAAAFDEVRGRLRDRLDDAYPSYEAARAAAAPGQRLAASLEETATGRTGDLGIDARARSIVAPVFEQSNSRYIADARAAFEKAGRMEEWNAGVRAYLQDAVERASRSQEGLNPAMLRRQVWANTDVREAMRAAMTPGQFEGFNRFMRVVENTARTFPQNSLTAARGNAAAVLSEKGGDAGTAAYSLAARVLSPFRLADTAGAAGEALAGRRATANVSRVVDYMFSPEGVAYLEQMAKLSPNTQRALSVAAQLAAPLAGGEQQQPQ